MEADDLLCSRNARPQKALVGRAQWKINQPPSLKKNEQAWREHVYRSMCAVEGSLGHSPILGERDRGKRKGPGDSLCSRNARSRTPLVGRAHVGNRQAPSDTKREKGCGRVNSKTPILGLCSRNACPGKGLVRLAHIDQYGKEEKRRVESEQTLEGNS